MSKKLQSLLAEAGVESVNVPKWTPDHQIFKGVVVAAFKDSTGKICHGLFRFGNWAHPNNQSKQARMDWKARNGKKIHMGKRTPEYWAWYYNWAPGATSWQVGDPRPSGIMVKGGGHD